MIEILTACCVSISTFLLSSSAIWLNHSFSLFGIIFIIQMICETILTETLSMIIMMINICYLVEPQLHPHQTSLGMIGTFDDIKHCKMTYNTIQVHYQSIIQPPQSSPFRHSLPPWGALATELLKMDKLLGMLTLVLVSASLIKGRVSLRGLYLIYFQEIRLTTWTKKA